MFSKHGPFHIDRKAKEAREHKGLAVTASHSEVDTDNPKASPLLWTLRKARTGDPSRFAEEPAVTGNVFRVGEAAEKTLPPKPQGHGGGAGCSCSQTHKRLVLRWPELI